MHLCNTKKQLSSNKIFLKKEVPLWVLALFIVFTGQTCESKTEKYDIFKIPKAREKMLLCVSQKLYLC